MGGPGSGQHFSHNCATVSDCLQLDVRRWQRDGLLVAERSFTWQWTRGGEVIGSIKVQTELSGRVICPTSDSFRFSDHTRIRPSEEHKRVSLY